MPLLPATLRVAPNHVVESIMRRRDTDPDRMEWGNRLMEWERSLRGLRGGQDAARERSDFERELRAYREACLGRPSDHSICEPGPRF